MRIYLTHCSAKKDNSLKGTRKKVTPDLLYISKKLLRFVNKCKKENVNWAIFSDKYGVCFPYKKYEWYDKHPSKVTEREFVILKENFEDKLREFTEIWFYYNPSRFNRLYKRLLEEIKIGARIVMFTHISEIE